MPVATRTTAAPLAIAKEKLSTFYGKDFAVNERIS
jgi:hypothetical protein